MGSKGGKKKMRKNLLKRIGAVALAVAVSLTMGVTSFAAGEAELVNGVASSDSTTLIIPKGLTMINAQSADSYGPNITFTYSVEPASVQAGTTITDNDGHTGTLNAGPTGGMTLASSNVVFPGSQIFSTSPAGTEAKKNITLNLNLDNFSKPGIYRYVLTDTTATSALFAAGITRADDYQTARYIDVFIKNDNGSLAVYGYALKATNDATNNEGKGNTTGKDPGFIKDSAVEGADKTDKYETYNVELTKVVSGTLADTTHPFPFEVTISNDGKSYFAAKGDLEAARHNATSETSLSTTLKNGETYTIAGLSPRATVAVQETNDTTDLYEVTAADASSALTVSKDGNDYSIAAAAISDYMTANSDTSVNTLGTESDYKSITYTNTLNEVSPTNVVVRFAPYLFILGAAIVLLVMMRRRKSHDAE